MSASINDASATATSATIDKSTFTRRIPLIALNIPARATKEYMDKFDHFRLLIPKVKGVYDVPADSSRRLLALKETVSTTFACTL